VRCIEFGNCICADVPAFDDDWQYPSIEAFYVEPTRGRATMALGVRVQLTADKETIAAVEQIAAQDGATTERREPPSEGMKFGLVEVAALIVVAKSSAELAKIIVDVWKSTKHDAEVTITTPKGTVTVKGASSRTVDEVLEQLKPVVIG
jgi:hypothetical protein